MEKFVFKNKKKLLDLIDNKANIKIINMMLLAEINNKMGSICFLFYFEMLKRK